MKGKPRFASCLQFMLGRQKLLVPNSEGISGGVVAGAQRAPVAATTIAASACEAGGGGGGGACGAGDVEDDASFFDLEFAVPGDESAASDAEEERVEFNFAVAGEDVAASGGGEVVAVDAVAASAGADTGEARDGAEAERGEEQRPSGTACGGEVAVDAVAAPRRRARQRMARRRRRRPRRLLRPSGGAADPAGWGKKPAVSPQRDAARFFRPRC